MLCLRAIGSRSLHTCAAGVAGVVLTIGWLACAPPASTLTVTFPGSAQIEPGARIHYQGIDIGRVSDVTLHQIDARKAAIVHVHCAIENAEIQLRRDDRFEITTDGLLGDRILQITPAEIESPALADGSRVAGIPPFATRLRETAEETIDSFEAMARDTANDFVDVLRGQATDEAPTSPRPQQPAQ